MQETRESSNGKSRQAAELGERLEARTALVGVIGMGYVGLPLAVSCARAGFAVTGFDIDPAKIEALNAGRSYIEAITPHDLAGQIKAGRFEASAEFGLLARCDVIVICVPTPLSKQREPDLSYVENTARTIARFLRAGQMVILESTTWPGTTQEVLKPILCSSGLKLGEDFWLGFSPEREDPGNPSFRTANIPKVVAGDGPEASQLIEAFYAAVVTKVIPVSSPTVAEAVKITENVFRAVNIALVNELKVIYDAMGIDVWEVIDAASTKPFGYMPFYPGPGLGGHCIPVDPFYLAWKSREYGISTRFIELAGEINVSMPRYVIGRLEEALDQRLKVSLSSARVLIIGLAYKKNVSDIRESPSLVLIEQLERRGTAVDFHDPHVREIPLTREHKAQAGRRSVELEPGAVARYDAVLISTDHDAIDYPMIVSQAKLILDTRNVIARKGLPDAKVVKA